MMEFEEEHEEEEEEEEEEESEMAITPTFKKQQPAARYRECLKNHAVSIGGHAVDGCGEFLPAGADGTLDALRCAACNCHRNFHRKELLDNSTSSQLTLYTPRPHHQVYQFYPYNRTTTGYLHVSGQRPLPLPSPPLAGPKGHGHNRDENLNVGGVVGAMSNNNNNDGNNNNISNNIGDGGASIIMAGVGSGGAVNVSGSGGTMMSGGGNSLSSGKKRFRTKFSADQKDKMLVLAERLGWRIQKQDEEVVQQFCHETGVKRHVLKVWMHNNKHTLGKKP